MEKTIAGLIGAVAVLGTLDAAAAAPMAASPVPSLQASSFTELLEPIPNAADVLRIVDSQTPTGVEEGRLVQVGYHHHHHHHHHHWRRHRHHHHHHHHHY